MKYRDTYWEPSGQLQARSKSEAEERNEEHQGRARMDTMNGTLLVAFRDASTFYNPFSLLVFWSPDSSISEAVTQLIFCKLVRSTCFLNDVK